LVKGVLISLVFILILHKVKIIDKKKKINF
jgi:hypothetical protein